MMIAMSCGQGSVVLVPFVSEKWTMSHTRLHDVHSSGLLCVRIPLFFEGRVSQGNARPLPDIVGCFGIFMGLPHISSVPI